METKKDTSIEAVGVKGMKSKPWRKTFKNQAAMEKWFEKNGGDVTVHAYRRAEESEPTG